MTIALSAISKAESSLPTTQYVAYASHRMKQVISSVSCHASITSMMSVYAILLYPHLLLQSLSDNQLPFVSHAGQAMATPVCSLPNLQDCIEPRE